MAHDEETYLRVASPEDAEALSAIYAPYVEQTAISFEYEAPTPATFRGRIEETLRMYPYLVAIQNDRTAGYAYTGPFHARAAYAWSAETSIYLAPDAQKRGLGRLLYGALESVSRAQGIRNLYACIGCPETDDDRLTHNSARFHAHMGYAEIASFPRCGYKFGRWYGIVYMGKQLAEHTPCPPPFVPFPALEPATLAARGIRR